MMTGRESLFSFIRRAVRALLVTARDARGVFVFEPVRELFPHKSESGSSAAAKDGDVTIHVHHEAVGERQGRHPDSDTLIFEREAWNQLYHEQGREILELRGALDTLRHAWDHHMSACPMHAALPVLDAPSPEDIRRWMNAPSDTASAGCGATPDGTFPCRLAPGHHGPHESDGGRKWPSEYRTTLLAESFRTEPRETPAHEALQGAYRSRTGVSLRTDGKPQSPCKRALKA